MKYVYPLVTSDGIDCKCIVAIFDKMSSAINFVKEEQEGEWEDMRSDYARFRLDSETLPFDYYEILEFEVNK